MRVSTFWPCIFCSYTSTMTVSSFLQIFQERNFVLFWVLLLQLLIIDCHYFDQGVYTLLQSTNLNSHQQLANFFLQWMNIHNNVIYICKQCLIFPEDYQGALQNASCKDSSATTFNFFSIVQSKYAK